MSHTQTHAHTNTQTHILTHIHTPCCRMIGQSYTGRSILAPNSQFAEGVVDDRGYVPVEWWLMSKTMAENEQFLAGEGITQYVAGMIHTMPHGAIFNRWPRRSIPVRLVIGSKTIGLPDAVEVAESELMGSFCHMWPLTKVGTILHSVGSTAGRREVLTCCCSARYWILAARHNNQALPTRHTRRCHQSPATCMPALLSTERFRVRAGYYLLVVIPP